MHKLLFCSASSGCRKRIQPESITDDKDRCAVFAEAPFVTNKERHAIIRDLIQLKQFYQQDRVNFANAPQLINFLICSVSDGGRGKEERGRDPEQTDTLCDATC